LWLHHKLLRPVFIIQFIFNTPRLLLAVFVPYAVRHLGFRHWRRHDIGDVRRPAWWSAACGDAGDEAPRLRHRIGLARWTGFVAAAVMGADQIVPTPLLAA